MKENDNQLFKNVLTSILIIIAIILFIAVITYNKISIGRVIPRVEEYQISEDIKEELSNEEDEQTEFITTYKMDASDLKQYEKDNIYNKGKQYPFSSSQEGSTNTENEDEEGNKNNSTNFFKDDGTK